MKFYGFGTHTRHDDEFVRSGDMVQGHVTTGKKRYNKRYKASARQAAKRDIRDALGKLDSEIIQTHSTSRQRRKTEERKNKQIAKQEKWQRLQAYYKSDLYFRHKAWLESQNKKWAAACAATHSEMQNQILKLKIKVCN